jgi:hypothetical protein
MNWDKLTRTVQIVAGLVAIPAAFAGVYSVYRTYLSQEMECQSLRSGILATIDRHSAADIKGTLLLPLLRRDVAEFDKKCGRIDPEAQVIFQAAILQLQPSTRPTPLPAPTQAAKAGAGNPSTDGKGQDAPAAMVFGLSASGERRGWVALSRGDPGHEGEINFDGYAISETSLPPIGTVLTARRVMPVWHDPQRPGPNDPTKLQGRVARGGCVQVLGHRVGPGRLWAEVAPIDCR